MIKISIITVCLNSEKTIEQSIKSVINQDYKNIEYVIIDGGSSDNTIKIINKYNRNISKWISEPDSGIYNAMNKGISLSTGDYIYILGSDDCLADNQVITYMVNSLDRKISLLSAPVWKVNEENNLQILFKNNINESKIFEGNMLPHPGMIVKRKYLIKYMFNEKNRIASDYEFLLQYVLGGHAIKYVDRPICYFSLNGISSLGEEVLYREMIEIMEKYNIKDEFIYKYKNAFIKMKRMRKLKSILIKVAEKLYFKKYILLLKGWKRHKCTNECCRWCKNNNGGLFYGDTTN